MPEEFQSNTRRQHRQLSGKHRENPKKIAIVLLVFTATLGLALPLCGFTAMTTNPNQALVLTSDVNHFWQAFDAAAKLPPAQRAAVYQRDYVDRASQGLKDYLAQRHVTTASLAQHVEQNRAYYAKVRPYIGQVVDQKPVIKAAFRRLKNSIPHIKFPEHVYFVVGVQRGAGMNSAHGIILAAEMFATPPGTPYSYNKTYPSFVPFAVVHETIHFNQTFQPGNQATLLQYVITEGTADFIASLTLPEPDLRQYTDRWHYGCPHEAELAARFETELNQTSTGPWMYNHHPNTGWPPDMGYWLGYRIDQTFYDRADNKLAALRAMLRVMDFKAFLKDSGYPGHRPACKPQAVAHPM